MSNDPYKAWLDAMPIDDVRHRVERLERKISDLQVLERLYVDRQHTGPETSSEPTAAEAATEPTSAEASSEPAVEEAPPESEDQRT